MLALRPARDAVLHWLRAQPGIDPLTWKASFIHPARPGATGRFRRLGSFGRYAGREVALLGTADKAALSAVPSEATSRPA